MTVFGVNLTELNAQNLHKLVVTLLFACAVVLVQLCLRRIVAFILRGTDRRVLNARFWIRQAISLCAAIILILGVLSIWFTDPARMAGALGLATAGISFALQQVITSVAGYFVILRGANFTIGDRIEMGGVRGDVVALGFIQTTIMEMGEPPKSDSADQEFWVKSRQFTGRMVTVSNSKIFDDPVFNFTRHFPYVWDEISLPVPYDSDDAKAEEILLDVAHRHAANADALLPEARKELEHRFGVTPLDLKPATYYRMTDNWIEITVRFILDAHGIRQAKDKMYRDILKAFRENGLGVASGTYQIVGFPEIKVQGLGQ